MKSNRASKLDRWIPYVYYQNEIIRLLEVVGLVGAKISNANLQPHLTILDSDRESAAPYIDKIDRPFIVVHPGSNDARRRWDPENFARVADTLNEQFDVEIVLTGADSDAKEVMAVAQAMKTEPINLLDQLDLSAFIGLLSQTRLYVGNDSGPLHLALASGTKAVGIFMAENMNNFLPLYRSNFYPLIAWERRCPLCGLVLDKAELDKKDPSPCAHQVSMVDSITPEDGIRAAELLLNLP
jgi:ADP-heptose:LPS heptosyltransferase